MKKFKKQVVIDGEQCNMEVIVRYDDECGNGYPHFSITAEVIDSKGDFIMGGCCHDEIKSNFPELAQLVKYHGVTSSHIVDNTLYHARTRLDMSKDINEPLSYDRVVKIGGVGAYRGNVYHKELINLVDLINSQASVRVVKVTHDEKPELFKARYKVLSVNDDDDDDWYGAHFNTLDDAKAFIDGVKSGLITATLEPSQFNEPVTPDVERARACCVWQDATLEQLQDRELVTSHIDGVVIPTLKEYLTKLGMEV